MGDCKTEEQKSIFISEEQKNEYLEQLRSDKMQLRRHNEKKRPRDDGEFQRDYSRIMYASSFRRLQGKMQLLGIKPDQFFRNRLTHSLEVAQIARSIASQAGYEADETYVVEAGALAHDIGNPPFGHAGEKKLHQIFEEAGGFEGNAQTLRIMTSVEKKKSNISGLNLTYRTMLSVVKYFHKYKEKNGTIHNKFLYNEDYNMLRSFVDKNDIAVRTLDVQIVDVADEIAYAAHDLEDGLRQKCFTIDEVLHDFYRKYGNNTSYKKLKELVSESRKDSGYFGKNSDSSIYSKLFRQELASSIIHCLIRDLEMCQISQEEKDKRGTSYSLELGFGQYADIANGLKEITFRCINHNDAVFTYEEKGGKILETLVEFYRKNQNFLPPEYRECNNSLKPYEDRRIVQERLICDYVSGMMDSYAINCYEKITGESFDEIVI